MAYWQWGDAQAGHVVLCVHGLTRQGRDFDVLAQALCAQSVDPILVVCPDVVGRGHSDWLTDPAGYQIGQYKADMLVLLKQLGAQTLDWVGTSMGGLIGMAVAGDPQLTAWPQVRRLVLNDVGPVIEWQAIQRIGKYLGHTGVFVTEQQAADALWAVSTSFGPHTPAQWLAFSRPMLRPMTDGSGRLTLHYDPSLALAFSALTPELAAQAEALLWTAYDQVRAQTLLLRGAESDLLSVASAQAMTQRGPCARCVEFTGVGHAPTLIAAQQVAVVCDFLLA